MDTASRCPSSRSNLARLADLAILPALVCSLALCSRTLSMTQLRESAHPLGAGSSARAGVAVLLPRCGRSSSSSSSASCANDRLVLSLARCDKEGDERDVAQRRRAESEGESDARQDRTVEGRREELGRSARAMAGEPLFPVLTAPRRSSQGCRAFPCRVALLVALIASSPDAASSAAPAPRSSSPPRRPIRLVPAPSSGIFARESRLDVVRATCHGHGPPRRARGRTASRRTVETRKRTVRRA